MLTVRILKKNTEKQTIKYNEKITQHAHVSYVRPPAARNEHHTTPFWARNAPEGPAARCPAQRIPIIAEQAPTVVPHHGQNRLFAFFDVKQAQTMYLQQHFLHLHVVFVPLTESLEYKTWSAGLLQIMTLPQPVKTRKTTNPLPFFWYKEADVLGIVLVIS